jgi:hypothetical protein
MKVQVKFKVINGDYDQKFANEYNLGKESDNNRKYEWEVSYGIKNVTSVELINTSTYKLKGKYKDGEVFEISIPNVTIFRFHLESGSDLDFAVSKSILNKTHQVSNEKYNITRCYFYINSEPERIVLTDNLIINVDELPEELKVKV